MTAGLTSFRDEGGGWHAHRRGAVVALCGLIVPPLRPGRRRAPTCGACVAAARALPVDTTPFFWGWRGTHAAVIAGARRPDPPVRLDGLCVVCLRERHPERSRRYARDAGRHDPFCSTACCRVYHDTALDGVRETTAA